MFYVCKIGYALTALREDENAAPGTADYVYIMHEGQIKSEGTSEKIKGSSEVREAYLGM